MSFRKAGDVTTALKVLAYGDTGTGKTYFAATFPNVAAVDSETGIIHYEKSGVKINDKVYKNILFVDNTSDLEDLENDLDLILNGDKEFSDIKTFVIDSETKFYDTMQVSSMEAEERRARRNGGDVADTIISTRGWGKIKLNTKKYQQMKLDIASKGVNVVSVAQLADLRDKQDFTKIIGEKADMHKSVPFDYDIILRFFTEVDAKTKKVKYFAEVLKDRTGTFQKYDILENATYDLWKGYVESNSGKQLLNTNYVKDLSKSIEDEYNNSYGDKEVTSEKLAQKIKSMANKITNATNKKKIPTIFSEKDVSFKNLELSPVSTLLEIIKEMEALIG